MSRRQKRQHSLFADFIPSSSNVGGPHADTTRPPTVPIEAAIDDIVPNPLRLIREPWKQQRTACRLSLEFKSSFVQLSSNRRAARSVEKGWGSVFGTHGADNGSWYFEAKILRSDERVMYSPLDDVAALSDTPSTSLPPLFEDWREDYELICGPLYQRPSVRSILRVGWSCRYARYDMPVGHSPFSVALCTATGAVINAAKLYPYCDAVDLPIKIDDVIGCRLHLHSPLWKKYSDPRRQPQLQYYVGGGVLCDPDHPPELRPNKDSFVEFSLNGKMLGKAPVPTLFEGVYHPALSLFNGASVSMNFGPYFKYFDNPVNTAKFKFRAAEDLPIVRF